MVAATPGFAGGWNDFVRVCLAPAEAFEPYVTHLPNADPVPEWVRQAEGEAVFTLGDATRFAVIETLPVDGRRACRVHDAEGAEAAAGFERWFEAEGARGRYVAAADVPADVVGWDSNEIFEPVLSAQMWREGGAVVLRMLETGRES
jgi:hypothetical protein